MKILHIIGSMDPVSGGPCQGIRNLDSEMKKSNVERAVVCLDDPKNSFIGNDSFPVYALGTGITSWHYSKKLKPWLHKHLQDFDIIIVNGLWLYPGFAVRRAFKRLKKINPSSNTKLFVMPHGMLDPYFQKAKERKWKAIRNYFYWHFVEKKLIQLADAVLFTCQTELELARTTFNSYHPKKEINIGYGTTKPPTFQTFVTEQFSKACPELQSDPYLLLLSRIHEKKGVDLLIKAYLTILENSKMQIPKLVIAGPGLETPYGKAAAHIVSSNPLLNDKVFFPGMLTGDAKWGAIYGCEAFILPSHQENFGIAIVEALACGKAVLITDKVNIWKDIISYGGGLVNEDSLEGIKTLLTRWLALDEDEKKNMEDQAKKSFDEHFDIATTAKKFMALSQ